MKIKIQIHGYMNMRIGYIDENTEWIHGIARVSMELPLYPWNHFDGSMELLGYICGYMTYLTDFKCFYYKNVSRNWQCILGTTLWIHGYIYHHDNVYTQNH